MCLEWNTEMQHEDPTKLRNINDDVIRTIAYF